MSITAQESDRFAERFWNEYGSRVESEELTFDEAWEEYLDSPTARQNMSLKKSVITSAKKKGFNTHPLFKKAGGKDINRDQQQTSKIVYKNKQKYLRATAQRSDFQGLDTKPARQKRVLKRTGRIKIIRKGVTTTRFVKAELVTIIRRKQKVEVLRDAKGRFVSKKAR